MKYVDEYRDRRIATGISRAVGFACRPERRYNFMEVCGTHTNTFFKFGLKTLIPENIRLLSGPGCPVCVTDVSYMDNVIRLSGMEGIIIATFGDMIRVPGTHSSLYKERTEGRDIKIVYSSLDALKIAETNPSKKVVFLAVGFETTSPTVALTLIAARKRRVRNFYVYVAHKL
ncbi:MAG: hydrogenase formation protein HypD, partial [Candidatus Omnitrophica bacterium]|nr:hydrogenase formation protein HypD [Candidatus Omnitrophota bacterium]